LTFLTGSDAITTGSAAGTLTSGSVTGDFEPVSIRSILLQKHLPD
jgi:hypothetical protein